MARIRITLGEADRDELGVDGDLVLDLERLKDMRGSEWQAWDVALDMPAALFLPLLESPRLDHLAQPRRVAVWMALQQAGRDVKWADCDPRLARATFSREADPSGPPAGPSESSSEDAPPASS